MGSYENIVKAEEIRKKVEEGDLLSAQKILDTMQLKKIKHISDLNLLAEVYMANERYDEATQLFLKVYDKTKTRKALGQLIDLSIRQGNVEDSQQYLSQYLKTAPDSFDGCVFRYRIEKLQGASYEQLINVLETLKKIEYAENWAYELAKLYYKAEMEAECIRECSDIILWFGEGSYVEKAKMLQSYYFGGNNKEKMMDELRRRSEAVHNGNTVATSQEEEATLGIEEAICSGSDFMAESGEEEFEDGLKKNIQDILTDEDQPEEIIELHTVELSEMQYMEIPEETPEDETDQGNAEDETDKESAEDVENDYVEEDLEEVENTFVGERYIEETEEDSLELGFLQTENIEQVSEKINDEQLEEDSQDEDDIKLNYIAEELGINLDEIFGNFLHVVSIKKQLIKSLESILQENQKTVLMIITGFEGAGKTTLAKDVALFLNKAGMLKSSKMAKISASKLNTVDIESKKESLKNCCLVVENASELKRSTIDKLLELIKQLQGEIAVIFEVNKKDMNKLFRECPTLMNLFKNRIYLPQYTQEDLMGFAYACLRQKDYTLNTKAGPILQSKMNQITKQSKSHTYLEQIYNLMLSAMNAADIRTGKLLANPALQGRLKDVEILSILPEDFKIKTS